LCAVVLVMDVRHPLTEFDLQMVEWCQHKGLALHILLTKADKLTFGAAKNTLMQVQRTLKDVNIPVTVQLFSALKKTGVDEVHSVIDQLFEKNEELNSIE
jgi:GTP-binding protein